MLTLAGPLIWAMHLLVIYGAHAVLCSRGVSGRYSGIAIAAATLVALVVLAAVPVWSRRAAAFGPQGQTRSFLWNAMVLLAVLSAFAIVWAGGTALFLSACLPMR
jgi:hypothetical protein